jgi:glutamate-ammonia-ligase adenylyltransferase
MADRLPLLAGLFLERRASELAELEFSPPLLRGLARVLGSNGEAARYLAVRPEILTRLAGADPSALERREPELRAAAPDPAGSDLEDFLDSLRLFRRDETVFAACLDLAGLPPFEEVSRFLSRVAEVVLDRVLAAAQIHTTGGPEAGISILAMGKLAGREITYSSDLDLIFLFEGDTEATESAARVAQRLIPYLSTPTRAGIAYAVDARLRPSGGQGLLVTSFDAYERYQLEQAKIWEHLALMRGRAVAGDLERAAPFLHRVQDTVRRRRISPWGTVRELRKRIADERTRELGRRVHCKAGAGGLMDINFLAAGAQLERGEANSAPALPSVPTMIEAAPKGPAREGLLEAHRFLRRLGARARWVANRAVEALPTEPEALATIAELVEPGLQPAALLERTQAFRTEVRGAIDRVLEADTITALG